MQNKSIWCDYYDDITYDSLNTDLDLDIAIIGGGITGLSVGYFLLNSYYKVGLFEKEKIGSGTTSKTTGKITYMQENILSKIKKTRNISTAKKYYDSQKYAIDLLINIINKNEIKCDLLKTNGYFFTTNKKDIKKIKEEEKLLLDFNEKIKRVNKLPDGLKIYYGISGENSYQFNPVKYVNKLKTLIDSKIEIYENSKVTTIEHDKEKFILTINNKRVTAKYLVVASHYPFFLFPYLMPLKCSLEKSFIGCYLDKSKLNFNAISTKNPLLSLRYVEGNKKRYKLILTNSCNLNFCQNDLNNFQVLLNYKPKYLWSNIDIITKDYMPYIGEIEKNMFIATGYNTWGMANSTLAGKIISDLILKHDNEFATLFSPKRVNFKTIIKYPLYMITNAYAYLNSKIIKKNNIIYKNIEGVNVAIYKDEEGIKHIVKNKCPHLGCSLLFNEVEKTWDCPCHASRFDIDGHVLMGPSNYDISFK
ncbi:MAG: FAD-dependent oxidoreductase [Bacilli bacterium]|nr:FAD-dependent oxidoreductase [Bacilli bacterium]